MQGVSGKMGKTGEEVRTVQEYFVYMLRCRGDVYYTGITPDVARRYRLHVSGKGAKFTRSHPPESLAAVWRCEDKRGASKVEYAIKKHLTRAQKEALIAAPATLSDFLPQLQELSIESVDITQIEL